MEIDVNKKNLNNYKGKRWHMQEKERETKRDKYLSQIK